jgi:hypothetical protein
VVNLDYLLGVLFYIQANLGLEISDLAYVCRFVCRREREPPRSEIIFIQQPHKIPNHTKHKPFSPTFHPSKSTMKLNLLLLSAAALVNAATAAETVNLGKAGDYTILAKTGISTVPQSSITGNIAVSPIDSTAITGFSLALDIDTGTFSSDSTSQVIGSVYAADYSSPTPATLTTAVSDMEAAYTDAAGRTNFDGERINLKGGSIGGETLTPGMYTFQSDILIDTDLTFTGSATDVFIIQVTGNVVQAANKKVTLLGGVLPANIFWQVAGQVNLGAGAHMEGILLVKTSVMLKTGSTLNGRVFTQTACDLQMATIAP